MTKLELIVKQFLETMIQDLRLKSFDEDGERRQETLERIETLKDLIRELKK